MAWLTTVRPDGQPVSVPAWFLLLEDETILIYSQPNKLKLRNVQQNPRVALGLDLRDIGRDIIRLHGTAQQAQDIPPADQKWAIRCEVHRAEGGVIGPGQGGSMDEGAERSVP